MFTLEPADGRPAEYEAGQYITLTGHAGREEVRRSYSMTSSPLLKEPLTIGVKRLENGAFSRLLFRLKPGNRMYSTGTGGLFTLPLTLHSGQVIVFLAAGAGITPVFSLLKTALKLRPLHRVILVYSNHSREQAVFLPELLQLQSADPSFHLQLLFSDDNDLTRARLSPEVLFRFLNEWRLSSDTWFYLCGPEAYMRMCLFTLREAGVQDMWIRKENFVVTKKEWLYPTPPDRERHEVVIDTGDRVASIVVEYPVTILDSARRIGLSLPFSCKAGVCGNCVATCVEGSVWMSNNEVLTETDLKKGLVLTCTGYPVFGPVRLKV